MPSGADGEADRRFPAPRFRSRQHQVRDVRARDDRARARPAPIRISSGAENVAAQPRGSGRRVGDDQPALEHALPELRALGATRNFVAHPVVARLEQRACLRARDAGAKTRHQTEPCGAVARPQAIPASSAEPSSAPDVRRFAARFSEKAPLGDADDGKHLPAQPESAADNRRVVRKPSRPVRVDSALRPFAGGESVVGRQNVRPDAAGTPGSRSSFRDTHL